MNLGALPTSPGAGYLGRTTLVRTNDMAMMTTRTIFGLLGALALIGCNAKANDTNGSGGSGGGSSTTSTDSAGVGPAGSGGSSTSSFMTSGVGGAIQTCDPDPADDACTTC